LAYQITIADYSSDWALTERPQHARTKPGYLTKEEVIKFYGSLGIQGMEVNHSYWYDYNPVELKRLANDAGVPIVAYVVSVDLAVPPAERLSALDELFARFDRTAELGASRVFLIPAERHPQFSLAEQHAWLIDALREAADRARSMGITIISENCDYPPTRPFMGRGADCRDICASVDSPNFRLIYDVAAPLFVGEDSLTTLAEMYPYTAHAHVKNFRLLTPGDQPGRFLDANDGKSYTGTTLDGGVLQIEPVVRELKRLGYSGFLQIEYQGEEDPRVALKHNVEYLRGILKQIA
jgi:sugar phosphate isomerase/epimerase